MSDTETLAFVLRSFRAFDDFTVSSEHLWWRLNMKKPLHLLVKCNDLFWWGTADCTELTPENIAALEATIAEVKALDPDSIEDAPLLWCARQRKQRPQVAYYEKFSDKMKPLFDACGPEDGQYGTQAFANKRKFPDTTTGALLLALLSGCDGSPTPKP